ncbi:transglycosylase SLT domain-containing protein [Chitinimonas sp.]|uniref:lytic transglycosylase domain-containing protein n=1 Tax=Chitinimonas sp. TaxID=1934313 RepID=UPI0035B20408
MRVLPALLFATALTAQAALVDDMNAAREAARTGNFNKLATLAPHLDGTVLEMYPRFWLLDGQIDKLADGQLNAFFERYPGGVLSERLRGNWLRALAKRGDWEKFEREWPKLGQWELGSDLHCYRLQLAVVRHDKNLLEAEAKPLWFTGKGLPEPCGPVFDAMFNDRQLSEEDAWARIRLAFDANSPEFAAQLLDRLKQPAGIDAKRIQAVAAKPEKAASLLSVNTRGGRELAVFAVSRLARRELGGGEALLDKLHLPEPDRRHAYSQLGELAIRKLDDRALDWFAAGEPANQLDAEGRAAWVRAALRANEWKIVGQVIDAMPVAERFQPAWRYWRGRAFLQAGQRDEADRRFAELLGDQSFYGLLAREDMGSVAVEMNTSRYKPSEAELRAARELPAVSRALALFSMDWRLEGVREWNWGMRGLTDRQLLAAAEVARQAGWYDRAIYSAERTRELHDLSLRFLAPYHDVTTSYAQNLNLDEAWVYGLIRQESRFVTVAKSGVGANGLMQLMPATARWVSKKIGVRYEPSAVNEIGFNIQLGTYYLKHVLNSLGSQPVLATAAYNAGPGRAKAWRADRALEGAIYAETIPFTETRDYVKKVMANAVYYARTFGHGDTSLKRRLGVIAARGSNDMPLDDTP